MRWFPGIWGRKPQFFITSSRFILCGWFGSPSLASLFHVILSLRFMRSTSKLLPRCNFSFPFVMLVMSRSTGRVSDRYEVVANLNSALLRAIASNRGIVVIAFLTCIWSAVFTRMYERKEKEILSEWDMINFKQRELERTEYVGDEKVRFLSPCMLTVAESSLLLTCYVAQWNHAPQSKLQISQKTGKLTRHYGVGRRRVRKMAFAPLILTSIFLIWICYWAIEIFKFTTELTLGEEYVECAFDGTCRR